MQDAEVGGTLRADSRRSNGARRPACLTSRQRLFVDHYLVHLNATQAAISAGYSAKTARSQGQRLLTKVDITAAVKAAMDERATRLEVKADRVVLEAARIAFADLGRMVRWGKNGVRLVESTKLSADDRAAVASVQERRDKGKLSSLAIKLHDKNGALVTLFRHLGLFNQHDQVNQKQLNALLDGMASVLQRYVDPGRVKEAILELTRIAQDTYARLEAPAPPDGRAA